MESDAITISQSQDATMAVAKKPKQKRSQIACVHCNRRRARCNASTIGLPCSACTDLGLTDCHFIQSKRRCSKNFLRKQSPPQAQDLSSVPPIENAAPQGKKPAEDTPPGIHGEREDTASASDKTNATESNESETWIKAANVISFGNVDGDTTVAYLGRTWLVPATSQQSEFYSASPMLRSYNYSWTPSTPSGQIFYGEMISSFFSTFHDIFPIIDRKDFNDSLQSKTLSMLLLDTVVLGGVTCCKRSLLESVGFGTRMDAIQHFYNKVLSCLHETNKAQSIVLIQCMFVLQFYWWSLTDWKDSKFWLASAIRQAQYQGLHKKAELQKLDASKQGVCRRIWWSLYIRDRQCASALGIPVMIQDEDCDVEHPTMDDMDKTMSLESKLAFLQLVRLMQEVRSLLQTEFGPTSIRHNQGGKESSREEVISACERWQAGIPVQLKNPSASSGITVFHLHIWFYTQILMFNRSIVHNPTKETTFIDINALVASHAASMITTLSEELAQRLDAQPLPFNCIYAIFAAVTVQIVERNNRTVTDNVKDEHLWMNLARLKQLAEAYPIALWSCRLLTRVVQIPDDVMKALDLSSTNGMSNTPQPQPQPRYPDQQQLSSTYRDQPHHQAMSNGKELELIIPLDSLAESSNIATTTTEMEEFFANLGPPTNVFIEQTPNFTSDWQAVYDQLELDKIPLF